MNKSQLRLNLYKKMYTIRKCEEVIQREYPKNEMKTPMHMSMGAEHIAVGVCHGLRTDDQVFSNHRSHAHFLAKTGDIEQFFLEMYGLKESVLGGVGGSMHLCMPSKGFMGSCAIVGGNISIAVGNAWANKIKGNGKKTVLFFGDGATEEGTFWESLNFACLKKIPIIFVCEDNNLAIQSKKQDRQAFSLLDTFVGFDNLTVFDFYEENLVEPNKDILNIYYRIKAQIDYLKGPVLYLFPYYRYLEHVGVKTDFQIRYRQKFEDNFKFFDPSKSSHWDWVDPIKRERRLLSISEKDTKYIENKIDQEIETIIERVRKKLQ